MGPSQRCNNSCTLKKRAPLLPNEILPIDQRQVAGVDDQSYGDPAQQVQVWHAIETCAIVSPRPSAQRDRQRIKQNRERSKKNGTK